MKEINFYTVGDEVVRLKSMFLEECDYVPPVSSLALVKNVVQVKIVNYSVDSQHSNNIGVLVVSVRKHSNGASYVFIEFKFGSDTIVLASGVPSFFIDGDYKLKRFTIKSYLNSTEIDLVKLKKSLEDGIADTTGVLDTLKIMHSMGCLYKENLIDKEKLSTSLILDYVNTCIAEMFVSSKLMAKRLAMFRGGF